jgi:hypothetical protein
LVGRFLGNKGMKIGNVYMMQVEENKMQVEFW